MSKDWENLSFEDLSNLIDKEGFHSAASVFKDNELKGCVIPLITDEHLKEMGINPVGTRLKLLKYLRKLCGNQRPPSGRSSQVSASAYDDAYYDAPPPSQSQRVARNAPSPSGGQSRPQMGQTMGRGAPQQSSPAKSSKRPTTAGASGGGGGDDMPEWKKKREKMIENIRAARKLEAWEKARAEGKDVGPPPDMPAFEEPEGLVQCPTCGRKMSEQAAKHHFPVCARMTADKKSRMRAGRY